MSNVERIPEIIENREYGRPINEYLLNKRYYEVDIPPMMNINECLLDGMNYILRNHGQEIKLDLENTTISKSKNYVPEQDKLKKDYLWHSWNALTQAQIDKNKEYYLFAVKYKQIENGVKYNCLLFKKDSFLKFLDKITKTANDRYFFYFAQKIGDSEDSKPY